MCDLKDTDFMAMYGRQVQDAALLWEIRGLSADDYQARLTGHLTGRDASPVAGVGFRACSAPGPEIFQIPMHFLCELSVFFAVSA